MARDHPIAVITGARQVGKSTFLKHAQPTETWRYVTLDSADALAQAHKDPEELWAGTDHVTLDEVQKAPELLSAVKKAVDEQPSRRFALSGSANLMLMKQVSESLAGRAVYFTMTPLTLGEMKNRPPSGLLQEALQGKFPQEGTIPSPAPDPETLAIRGSMPRLLQFPEISACLQWWEGYVKTFVERDLRQLSQVDSLIDFRRAMEILALRTGQVLNQSDVARDAQLKQPTFHRYLNLLEAACLVERVSCFARNRTSRLVKSPKTYWMDPALALFLSGIHDPQTLRASREVGAALEGIVYHHLRALCSLMTPAAKVYYWRLLDGTEVDFVIEHGRDIVAIEVKRTENPGYRDAENINKFIELHPETRAAWILHAGRQIKRLGDKIIAIPWHLL